MAAGASGCCVALLDEALELRRAGVTGMILVLGITPVDYAPIAAENDISLAVGDAAWLTSYQQLAETRPNLKPLKVHLAVDTGMGRIGFQELASFQAAVKQVQASSWMNLEGVFTHFATADADDADAKKHYQRQLKLWRQYLASLDAAGVRPRFIHAANSAVGMWHPDHATTNTVRMGISMYGADPSQRAIPLSLPLRPAMSLVSTLTFVKEVAPGDPVGYGATYHAKQREWIGTIPVGYADGYRRSMQDGRVLVNGQYCEIVGRVCMDQLMVRLPKKEAVGTPVTLLGRDGSKAITIDELAKRCGTINYEIMTGFSSRLNRRYIDHG